MFVNDVEIYGVTYFLLILYINLVFIAQTISITGSLQLSKLEINPHMNVIISDVPLAREHGLIRESN